MSGHPPAGVRILNHPLVMAKLACLREAKTSSAEFRQCLRGLGVLLAYEALAVGPVSKVNVQTPLEPCSVEILDSGQLVFAAILRAGLGLLDGMLDLVPQAKVGHVGLYRDSSSLEAVEYYYKIPAGLESAHVVLADPMLATGNSAVMAIDRIKADRPKSIQLVCAIAAPEGIEQVSRCHPDVRITTAALDRCLNEIGYILPGLGDAGDRLFGTNE